MAQPQRAEQSASPGARWLLAETGTHTPHCMGPWVLCVTAPPPISHALFYLCSSTWLLQLLSLQGIFCTFCHLCEISIFQASWP